jgi:hypothetical protein
VGHHYPRIEDNVAFGIINPNGSDTLSLPVGRTVGVNVNQRIAIGDVLYISLAKLY